MAKIFLNCTFCLRKHTSYDLHLHICKKVISLGFLFLFLQSFNFLGCWMTQKCHTSYLRKHASHDCNFWYTFVKWYNFFMYIFFQCFFHFLEILIFQFVRSVIGQKIMQNNKKCIPFTWYLKNCTSYNCDFWYTCVKWWYLQQVFFIFSKFWFSGFLGR